MPGCEVDVYRVLEAMECTKEAYRILGEFAILVIIRAKDRLNLDLCICAIRKISGVTGIWHILVSDDENNGQNYAATRTEKVSNRKNILF